MIVAARLRQRRIAAGMTQQQLAQRIGKRQGYIGDIENGKRKAITTDTLVKLCRALGCSADYLLGLVDDEAEEDAA